MIPIEFDGIRKEAGLNSFILTANCWIEATNRPQHVNVTHAAFGLVVHKPGALFLARVPKDKVFAGRDAYEWFTGMKGSAPAWGPLAAKKPVFENPEGTGWCVCAVAVVAVAWPCLSCAQSSAPKWSVYEISLTAGKTYANRYTETGVTAVFPGPNGLEKTASGFWDGGTTFKIRFTPTAEGTWSYKTSSSDAGLGGKTGSLRCAAPVAGRHGFPVESTLALVAAVLHCAGWCELEEESP